MRETDGGECRDWERDRRKGCWGWKKWIKRSSGVESRILGEGWAVAGTSVDESRQQHGGAFLSTAR